MRSANESNSTKYIPIEASLVSFISRTEDETFAFVEIQYLKSQSLMRFASASLNGRPDVAPVVFEIDGDDILTAVFDITHTVRYRNIQSNPRVNVVVDDLANVDPWSPRGIRIVGTAVIEEFNGSPRVRISSNVIISWAIKDTTPGIPKMERRKWVDRVGQWVSQTNTGASPSG